MIPRKRSRERSGVEQLMVDTSDLVARLVKENQALRTQNQRLAKELARLSKGWEELRKLARSAPKSRRSR